MVARLYYGPVSAVCAREFFLPSFSVFSQVVCAPRFREADLISLPAFCAMRLQGAGIQDRPHGTAQLAMLISHMEGPHPRL